MYDVIHHPCLLVLLGRFIKLVISHTPVDILFSVESVGFRVGDDTFLGSSGSFLTVLVGFISNKSFLNQLAVMNLFLSMSTGSNKISQRLLAISTVKDTQTKSCESEVLISLEHGKGHERDGHHYDSQNTLAIGKYHHENMNISNKKTYKNSMETYVDRRLVHNA